MGDTLGVPEYALCWEEILISNTGRVVLVLYIVMYLVIRAVYVYMELEKIRAPTQSGTAPFVKH